MEKFWYQIKLLKRFSQQTNEALQFAEQEALRSNSCLILPVHLVIGLLIQGESSAAQLLLNQGASTDLFRAKTPESARDEQPEYFVVHLSSEAASALTVAAKCADGLDVYLVQPEHLLVALLQDDSVCNVLSGIDVDQVQLRELAIRAVEDVIALDAGDLLLLDRFDQASAAQRARNAHVEFNASRLNAEEFDIAVQLAYPPEFWTVFEKLEEGDCSALDVATKFLEDDPWFFRSGYVKADLIRFINRMTLSEPYARRLREVVLKVVDDRYRREFRSYCRLACHVYSDDLRASLEARLKNHDHNIARRARWVLDATKHSSAHHVGVRAAESE